MMITRQISLLKALSVFALLNGSFSVAQEVPGWFNGYYVYADSGTTTTESISCEKDSTFVTSGTYANCCASTATGRCSMPTACLADSVTPDVGRGYHCTVGASCATMTIYETSPFGSPSATNIFCWSDWRANTVYRRLPSETTSGQKTPPITAAPEPTATHQAANPGSRSGEGSGSGSRSKGSGSKKQSGSGKGWIAGAVIGPVAAAVLAILGFVYYRRRQKQADSDRGDSQRRSEFENLQVRGGSPPVAGGKADPYGYGRVSNASGGAGAADYKENQDVRHEMLGDKRYAAHELPPSRHENERHEMP
ncbi:hypothetical protein AJ79_02160 [Helicocarpus griseus UAMH5409]|uniref:Mid2 domain-containing protein n=1 Tax=Helicocarpus griseus UAMH5409 TaxID=1447875 RepID=A0A2B7Y3F9_9EURO|nr:hypothetical protein AJ79_02160 [Helicocarpus griseus UAMH5409]